MHKRKKLENLSSWYGLTEFFPNIAFNCTRRSGKQRHGLYRTHITYFVAYIIACRNGNMKAFAYSALFLCFLHSLGIASFSLESVFERICKLCRIEIQKVGGDGHNIKHLALIAGNR